MLASVLAYFNDVGDDEVPRLFEQAKAIFALSEGSLSPNVVTCEFNIGAAYFQRANRVQDANDLHRHVANLELALPHYREAARICRAVNRIDDANEIERDVVKVEEMLRQCAVLRAIRG